MDTVLKQNLRVSHNSQQKYMADRKRLVFIFFCVFQNLVPCNSSPIAPWTSKSPCYCSTRGRSFPCLVKIYALKSPLFSTQTLSYWGYQPIQIITLLPIWKLLFNEPHPPKRFPRLGRRTAVTRSRPQIFISNVNILMSVALCKWIFMDIHEFIKLLLVETKHEWGSLNSDYSPPLTLADPCSHRSTPAVGFDSSRCTELQEQVLLYTKWKKIDTKLMWTHSLESSRANTRNIHSFMSHQRWVYVLGDVSRRGP